MKRTCRSKLNVSPPGASVDSSEFKYLDNNIYESKGFPPDIAVPFNEGALNQGRDPALEAAIINISQ